MTISGDHRLGRLRQILVKYKSWSSVAACSVSMLSTGEFPKVDMDIFLFLIYFNFYFSLLFSIYDFWSIWGSGGLLHIMVMARGLCSWSLLPCCYVIGICLITSLSQSFHAFLENILSPAVQN